MFESFLFGVFPYITLVLMIVGLVWRYVTNQFSYSSLSSQFLENRQLFWGSAWYVQTAAPYFVSLFTLSPKVEYMTALPLLSKLHAIGAFVMVGIFPFTRLVH